MKKKKKTSMLVIILIFFIVQAILAKFMSYEIRFGSSVAKPAVKIVTTTEEERYQEIGADGELSTDEYGTPVMLTRSRTVKVEEPLKVKKIGNFMSFVDTGMTTVDRIQDGITSEMFPDDNIVNGQVIGLDKEPTGEGAYSLTYGSKAIYDLFYTVFREKKEDGSRNPMKFFGSDTAVLNFRLVRMIIFIDLILIFLALYINRSLSFIPSKVQIVYEMFYGFFSDLVNESLGEKGAKFLPYYLTLFTYIWVCNWIGLLPIPGISEPTRNLNGTLGLGIMSILMIQYFSLKKKGFAKWGKAYLEPFPPMLPLNIVGELSKVVSVSFRLFGNIFGGAIIFIVVSNLIYNIVFPVVLNMYFTMFSGTIQAFVFTMLTLTYLSLEITE